MSIEFWAGVVVGLMGSIAVVVVHVWRTRPSAPTYEVYVLGTRGERAVVESGLTRREAKALAYSVKQADNVVEAFARKEGSSHV